MKIAIFHDHFGSIGGGEKLVLELAYELNADILTTEKNIKNLKKINIYNCNIICIGNNIKIPILKQINSSISFYHAYFPNYDYYIMSGNWSIFATKKHHPNLYYVHTPVRMFYDSKEFFYKIAPWYAKIPFLLWTKIHKFLIEKQLKYIDTFVANSINVKKRIKKYWNKDSMVINPPIKQYKFKKYGDYYLAVTRIYPHKRIELLIEVFKNLPNEKLVLVGGYINGDHSESYAKKVLVNLPINIRIIGEVTEKELEKLYGECKAFITLSRDEDFGMTILEANSAGKMVVATNEGGHKETVINGKTGYLVKAELESVICVIKKLSLLNLEKNYSFKNDCELNAKKYVVKNFVKKIRKQLINSDY